jgi:hypothetical protein
VTTNNSGGIDFSWNAAENADGYEVSRSATMIGGYQVINAITVRNGSRVQITDSNVNRGTSYFYSVKAANLIDRVTEYRIRQMCVSGQLPHFKAGKKFLIAESALMFSARLDDFRKAWYNGNCRDVPCDLRRNLTWQILENVARVLTKSRFRAGTM